MARTYHHVGLAQDSPAQPCLSIPAGLERPIHPAHSAHRRPAWLRIAHLPPNGCPLRAQRPSPAQPALVRPARARGCGCSPARGELPAAFPLWVMASPLPVPSAWSLTLSLGPCLSPGPPCSWLLVCSRLASASLSLPCVSFRVGTAERRAVTSRLSPLGGRLRCPLPHSGPGGMPLAATGPAPEAGVPGVPSPLSGAWPACPSPLSAAPGQPPGRSIVRNHCCYFYVQTIGPGGGELCLSALS